MISTWKLIKMAKKWQKKAALNRKLISYPKNNEDVTEKGHFVVYTADGKRYSIPIACLNNYIFRKLFEMSEEEYGIPSDGPIVLPCDAIFMDYLISLIQRKAINDLEQALLTSLAACRCSSQSSSSVYPTSQTLLSSF